jgi:hypothetical protein
MYNMYSCTELFLKKINSWNDPENVIVEKDSFPQKAFRPLSDTVGRGQILRPPNKFWDGILSCLKFWRKKIHLFSQKFQTS